MEMQAVLPSVILTSLYKRHRLSPTSSLLSYPHSVRQDRLTRSIRLLARSLESFEGSELICPCPITSTVTAFTVGC